MPDDTGQTPNGAVGAARPDGGLPPLYPPDGDPGQDSLEPADPSRAPGLDLGDEFGHSLVPGRRRRTFVTVTALVLVVALLVGGGVAFLITTGPGPVPRISPAAQRLLRSSLQAAARQGTFHYVSRFTSRGVTQTTVGDAGKNSGRQRITIGSDSFDVLVIGTACYFRGDARQLTDQLGVPASVASTYDGQWISLAPGDAPYQSVYAAVTAHDALAENIAFVPHRQLDSTRLSGRRVLGIAGPLVNVSVNGQTQKAKGTAQFYVAAVSHLPVRYSEKGTVQNQPGTFTMTFSAWGQPVTVDTPPGAVSFAILGVSGAPSVTSPQGNPTLVSVRP